ncbi:hypothetical protein [Borrelia anserina]|uniref:Outer membrane protein n=2 Tax=Borrelia anserina TaxID=143 RepID=W5SQR3_BORAN|nr:hypothetical protein [Borrelia anserina]AHH08983.1 Outer membrane protein [Borrelia anserina BA2]APR65353.1 hypothetical protein N187_A34 [Borrelia anserina Es]
MVKFKYIILFFSFFSFLNNLSASFIRPFDFTNWNFSREVEEAYDSSYEVVDDILVNVDDPNKNVKAKQVLQKIADLEGYYRCLVNMIRDEIFLQVEDEFLKEYGQYFDDDIFTETDNRFKQLIEIPMENEFGKYRHRVLSFSNKTWIKNPDYTKLYIKLQLKEIEFVENYIKQKLDIKLGTAKGSADDQRQVVQRQTGQGSSNRRYGARRSMKGNDDEKQANQRQMIQRSSDMKMDNSKNEGIYKSQRPVIRQNDGKLGSKQQANQVQRSHMSKSLKPSSIKQGNLRPSSTRPAPKRPGSDIRPSFVRPIVRPLDDNSVNLRSGYEEDNN